MSKIRIIENEKDQKQYADIAAYCFADHLGWSRKIFPLYHGDKVYGMFDGDRLMAGVMLKNLKACFKGTPYPLAGISCVVTAPEYRNRGHIRALMGEVLVNAEKEGFEFSALYPFRFRFYEKFGYGFAGGDYCGEFDLSAIRSKEPPSGILRPFNGTEEELESLFREMNRWKTQFNLGVLHNPLPLEKYLADRKWLKENIYVYEKEGGIKGVLIYKLEKKEHYGFDCRVQNLIWRDREALDALFYFMYTHRAQCYKFSWRYPRSLPFRLLFDEPRIQETFHKNWMIRPLALEKHLALKADAQPVAEEILFSVKDEICPRNTGTYRIKGQKAWKEEFQDRNTLPLEVVSSLLYGGYSLSDGELTGVIRGHHFPPAAYTFFQCDYSTYFGLEF